MPIVLATLLGLTMVVPGCSTQTDSVPELGTAEDYIARRENATYIYGYAPYDLCAAHDPYCFAPYWYSAPIYYFSRGDGDNDCDDDNCRSHGNGFHDKLATRSQESPHPVVRAGSSSTFVAVPHGFEATVPPAGLAHLGPLFVAGGFRSQSRR